MIFMKEKGIISMLTLLVTLDRKKKNYRGNLALYSSNGDAQIEGEKLGRGNRNPQVYSRSVLLPLVVLEHIDGLGRRETA